MKKIIIFLSVLTIYLPSFAQATERKYIRKGNIEYENSKYEHAEVLYRKALEKNINSRKAEYNLANTLYKQNKNDAAAVKYKGLIENEKNRIEKSKYYYNMGNALFKDNKIDESIEAYKNALRNNPQDEDAKHNLQLALRMRNRGGPPQGQQNQQDQQNQQNQDKQNQSQQNQQDKQAEQQQNQSQTKHGQISKEDAERLLQALENDEKKVLQKVKEKESQVRKVQVEKDW